MIPRVGRGNVQGAGRSELDEGGIYGTGESNRLQRLRNTDGFDGGRHARNPQLTAGGSTHAAHKSFFARILEFLASLFSGGNEAPAPATPTPSKPVSVPAPFEGSDGSDPVVAQPDDGTSSDVSARDTGNPSGDVSTPAPTGESVESANAFFLTQLSGSAWNTSGGGSMDCGPTSALMVLSSLGLVAHPTPSKARAAIDQFRGVVDDQEGLGPTAGGDDTVGVTVDGLEGAIRASGGRTTDLPDASDVGSTLDAINQQLDSGAKVIAYGDPSKAWESDLGSNYQEKGSFSHFVAVLGRSDDGNYLVGDPLSRSGVIEATPSELASYMRGGLQLDPPFGGAFAVSK